jgi:hypothetical protein
MAESSGNPAACMCAVFVLHDSKWLELSVGDVRQAV